jgi:hybrid cluster-associated redox disulfide protein
MKGENMEITKNTIISDILEFDEGTAEVFLELGMHCLHCPMSRGETLEEACAAHCGDVNVLIEKLNEKISA